MPKYDYIYTSRRLPAGQSKEAVGELFDGLAHCHFEDDAESNNDMTVAITSDGARHTTISTYNTNSQTASFQTSAEVPGTRTSAAVFTRTASVWTANALVGYMAKAYVSGFEDAATWLKITSNTATSVSISGALPVNCDRIKISAQKKFRNTIQIVPRAGMYGAFFQVAVNKKIPSDGVFKWKGVDLRVIPRPSMDNEFFAGTSGNTNAWSE